MKSSNKCSVLRVLFLTSCATLAAGRTLRAQEALTDRVRVEADRLPAADSTAPFTIHVLEADELRRAPQLRLDDVLRAQVPGFSLFRRNSSRTANPTTQGVTLRNFGPSGAGRTLVLLDGIPLNDPFAGYVLWNQVPLASIASVVVNPGGGAGLFGNSAIAGTIFLVSAPLQTTSLALEGSAGNRDSYEASIDATWSEAPFAISLFAEGFSTGGYPVVARDRRGSVDSNASADSSVLNLQAAWQISSDTSLRVSGRRFDEDRGNGTSYTRNATAGNDLSAVFTQRFSQEAELQLGAYAQQRNFRATFSSINAARTIETPALDQFRVPADALGGSAVWSMLAGDHHFVVGSDARFVEGETNENFLWNGTTFRRLRVAGGSQIFSGVFAEDTWSANSVTTIVGGVRFDHWELFHGSRKETDRATGHVLTDAQFPDRDGNEINGRLGLRFQTTKTFALRGAGYSGFRLPTLNELYRPFRVGNDVTEANAALQPEHLLGGEVGFEWQAASTFRFTGTGFVNRLEDAVSNVTIGYGPGTFNPGGFIPAGGVLRQRQNVDLVVAPGAEATADWQLLPTLHLRGGYIFTRPTIERATDPGLRGKLLAQTPEHVFTGGVEWNPAPNWFLSAQVRMSTSQFEDDQNSRVLASFTTFDAAVRYDFSTHASATIRVENLFNTEIESGRSANGVVSLGAPRLVSLQMRWAL
ncbi:MAG: TonB-dependent receptor [Chthoniobacterales bacterium]